MDINYNNNIDNLIKNNDNVDDRLWSRYRYKLKLLLGRANLAHIYINNFIEKIEITFVNGQILNIIKPNNFGLNGSQTGRIIYIKSQNCFIIDREGLNENIIQKTENISPINNYFNEFNKFKNNLIAKCNLKPITQQVNSITFYLGSNLYWYINNPQIFVNNFFYTFFGTLNIHNNDSNNDSNRELEDIQEQIRESKRKVTRPCMLAENKIIVQKSNVVKRTSTRK